MKLAPAYKILLCVPFLIGSLYSSLSAQAYPEIQKGVLDASGFEFKRGEKIELTGDWEFYWDSLLSPGQFPMLTKPAYYTFPKLWNEDFESFGYATYRLTVKLPEDHPPLALSIPDFYSAYKLYINGEIAAQNGNVGTIKNKYIPKWIPQTIPIEEYETNQLELILQIANFDHSKGGPKQTIELGTTGDLYGARELELGYAYGLTGALIMGGLFFFGLFLFGRHETPILFFSLFCLTYSYRIIGFGIYPLHFLLPEIPWIVTLKLEYITLFLSGYLFGIYTLNLYPRETSRRLIYFLSFISVLFIVITILFKPIVFTKLIEPYFIVLTLYIFYAFYIYILAVINKRLGAQYALASTGVVFIVFLYQIMVYFGFVNQSLLLNFFGYIAFFFFQSLVLSFRFADSLKRALSKAEEASKAKSQFLSTMSHEIRTPLNAVIGLSGLMVGTKLDNKQSEFINTIKLSGENLLSIINNILDYSKIESGKLELENSEFGLRELVENVLEVVSSLNNNPDLELIYLMEEGVPEYIISDRTRLQQVLINLVGNALKFTEQGEIVIYISMGEEDQQEAEIFFSVRDTGIGIPEKLSHRLFQSFSQVDASTTRKYGGTGLGLVISKKLVNALGGDIAVESIEGQGSIFTFSIHTKKSDRVSELITSKILEGKKVFILDDNQTNLDILTRQCQDQGIEVFATYDPGNILKKVSELDTFDFGIMDMQMPETNGIEIAQAIRNKWNKIELPVVLLSSIHEIENQEDISLFNLYLKKPVKQSQLIGNLERLFYEDTNLSEPIELPSTSSGIPENVRILLVEDNVINQKVGIKILERIGIQPDLAINGYEAIQKCRKVPYDIVFMDMEMPIMDGITATVRLREQKNKLPKNPAIIAMTANALREDKERCIAAGMDDFIAKPITVESMKELIKLWT